MQAQRKLVVGAPDDQYEREADVVARRVVSAQPPVIQRCSCKEPEEAVQKAERCGSAAAGLEETIERRLFETKGIGAPLSDEARGRMEPHFGIDLSSVTIHTDGNAAHLSRALNPRAFTHGSDVYFGEGESPSDVSLLAHELTHVVQQTGGVQRISQTPEQAPHSAPEGWA
jgi:hypothetical protein